MSVFFSNKDEWRARRIMAVALAALTRGPLLAALEAVIAGATMVTQAWDYMKEVLPTWCST